MKKINESIEKIIPSFQWVSPKKYSEVTGMGYQQVLSLCRTNKLECVEKDGGEQYKQYLIKLSINGDMVPRAEYNELLEKYTKLATKMENIKLITTC